jgi:hypothetical protein
MNDTPGKFKPNSVCYFGGPLLSYIQRPLHPQDGNFSWLWISKSDELKDLFIVLHFIMVGHSAWLQWLTDYPPAYRKGDIVIGSVCLSVRPSHFLVYTITWVDLVLFEKILACDEEVSPYNEEVSSYNEKYHHIMEKYHHIMEKYHHIAKSIII